MATVLQTYVNVLRLLKNKMTCDRCQRPAVYAIGVSQDNSLLSLLRCETHADDLPDGWTVTEKLEIGK
jgi:hypothetical protein